MKYEKMLMTVRLVALGVLVVLIYVLIYTDAEIQQITLPAPTQQAALEAADMPMETTEGVIQVSVANGQIISGRSNLPLLDDEQRTVCAVSVPEQCAVYYDGRVVEYEQEQHHIRIGVSAVQIPTESVECAFPNDVPQHVYMVRISESHCAVVTVTGTDCSRVAREAAEQISLCTGLERLSVCGQDFAVEQVKAISVTESLMTLEILDGEYLIIAPTSDKDAKQVRTVHSLQEMQAAYKVEDGEILFWQTENGAVAVKLSKAEVLESLLPLSDKE